VKDAPAGTTYDWLALPHGELFWPDLTRLLAADCIFNPSITKWRDALWMVYRRIPQHPGQTVLEWPRLLALCRTGPDLQADPTSNVDLSARIVEPFGARQWHADARFFTRATRPWISYHDNSDLYVVPLNLDSPQDAVESHRIQLVGRRRRPQERNWGFFDDGQFKAVYSIDPHVILRIDTREGDYEGWPIAEEQSTIPWDVKRWGEPHGGSCPVLVGDCWFSFFQSHIATAAGGAEKVYRVGFYGFDAIPPHRIRYMCQEPLLHADMVAGPRSFYLDHAVIYPSGAVYSDGNWLVSLGVHDRRLAFSRFDHNRLLAEAETL